MLAFALLPLLALGAAAIKVVTPSNSTGWTSTGAQIIEWTSVSTDPSNFTIQLISPSSPNSPTTLAQNIDTAEGEYLYTPAANLAPGKQWRVNIISSTNQAGILAQSEYFEVVQGDAVSSSASSSSASSTSSASRSASATSSISGTQTGPSTSSSSAPATSSSAAADRTVAGMSGVGVVAVAILSYFA